jgi:Tetratricopeptide repeat
LCYVRDVRVAWVLLVSSVALAAPSKPVRKPPPQNLEADMIEAYVEALIFDKAGDYEKAVQRYRRFDKEEPNIQYNLADLYRRMEDPKTAIDHYKKYLALAPNATDRALVQKLVDQLAKTPQTIVVDGEDLDAVVFIDGKAVGPSPYVGTLADGPHVVDRIGPTSFQHNSIEAKPLDQEHMTAYREETGNVVMSTPVRYGGSWTDGGKTFRMHDRFTLPPGRVDTYFFEPGRACSPVSFEVPEDGVVYVYIEAPRDMKRGACTPIKVTAQKLAFPKAAK